MLFVPSSAGVLTRPQDCTSQCLRAYCCQHAHLLRPATGLLYPAGRAPVAASPRALVRGVPGPGMAGRLAALLVIGSGAGLLATDVGPWPLQSRFRACVTCIETPRALAATSCLATLNTGQSCNTSCCTALHHCSLQFRPCPYSLVMWSSRTAAASAMACSKALTRAIQGLLHLLLDLSLCSLSTGGCCSRAPLPVL